MSNPMDHMEVLRDLLRKEEAEHLHNEIHDLFKAWQAAPVGDHCCSHVEHHAALKGLSEAMLIVDARIGHLRDRWG
jgi:uncharacterized protein (DUF2267 family)